MLRTKQIGTLSQCARSFFLSNSRCNAADASTCSCSEDESCISKKNHDTTTKIPLLPKQQALIPKSSQNVNRLISEDVLKSKDTQEGSFVNVTDAIEKESVNQTLLSADQFIRAGIAAVNILSDLVNFKLPISDGTGLPKNCMVSATGPASNIKPSNVRPTKRDTFPKVHEKINSEIKGGADPARNCPAKGKAEKYVPVKGFGDSGQKINVHSDLHEQRKFIPHQTKDHSNRFRANSFSSGRTQEGFRKPFRGDARVHMGINPTASRQFSSTSHVVEKVSNILKQLKWGQKAEEALLNLNCSLDAYQANQILKQIQDCSVASGLFYWLKRQPGFKHDEHTYTTMVGILGRAKQFDSINKLLDQMVRDGCQPNVVTYNRLIHSYGRANFLTDAINVFNRMVEVGCEPDRVTYCTLIDIHAKAGFLDVAMYMYQRMQEAGLKPDTFTYSVIINCLGKAGHLNDAHKLFCEMTSQGCIPNLVTYNIMIALQAKARNYPVALKLYREMQNAGFEPDKVTYSIVMEVLGHCGFLEEAEAIFSEMKRKNWIPDEPVYGLLVDLWGKTGNAEKAYQWYQAMLNAGLCPNVPTCNSLLSAFLRVHRLSDAYHLLQSMLALGLNPSLQTYTLLLSCCTEARSPFDMGFCCELMAVTGHPAHSFLLSMPAPGPDGQNVRDHVGNFLDLMHTEDRESKRGLVDAIVDFLHKSGLKEEAGSVWEVAAQKNVYPDAVREKSSSYWLINLHVMSDGTAVTALSRTLAWFRKQMLVSGIGPGRIDIVTGWGRRSRVMGSSMVRQSVQELLHIFSFPFLTENGNSGCFVGCGESLDRWLLQSYVDRMHLL